MSGEEVKAVLRQYNVNLSQLAKALGYDNDQRLHSALKARDVKSGLIESIARELGRGVGIFYGQSEDETDRLRKENTKLKAIIGELLDIKA